MSDFTPCTTPEDLYREGFAAGLTIYDERRPRESRHELARQYLGEDLPQETLDGIAEAAKASIPWFQVGWIDDAEYRLRRRAEQAARNI